MSTIYSNLKKFNLSQLQIGDYVTFKIVEMVVTEHGTHKPTILCGTYAQSGIGREAYDHVLKKKRKVYHAFRHDANGYWRYCGECFPYETEQRILSPKQLVLEGVYA